MNLLPIWTWCEVTLRKAESPTERPVVLIVEDEFLVRMAVAEAISDAGFEIVEAANADQAIAILENRRDIRVVFTDIQMPGFMDGAKPAHAVRNRWPPIHIIATSGRYNFRRWTCLQARLSSRSHIALMKSPITSTPSSPPRTMADFFGGTMVGEPTFIVQGKPREPEVDSCDALGRAELLSASMADTAWKGGSRHLRR